MGLKTISPVSLPSVVGCGFLMEDCECGDGRVDSVLT